MGLFSPRETPAPRRSRVRVIVPDRRAVTAAATTISRGNESTVLRRLAQPWHAQALGFYDTVGECWYPAQFYARVLPKIRFFPAMVDERGDIQEVESGPLVDLWERVQDPGGGGRSQLVASYGQLMFLTGDGYLIAHEEDGEEAWEYVSPLELRIKPDTGSEPEYQRIKAPGLTPEELIEAPDSEFGPIGEGRVRVWRLYRRHPAYSAWSDSPVRAVLDLYQLVKLLTLAVGAEATSRAASNGLFYWPDEMFPPNVDTEEGDENPMKDPLFQEIQEAAMANIKDPGSAAAAIPIMLRGPGLVPNGVGMIPVKELMGLMPMSQESSYSAVAAWKEVIQRIENGLDGPDGLVTGGGDVNHWNGWLLDEQGYTQHVEPVAAKFAADMVSAYLRPAARDDGIAGWENVTIGIDAAAAILHPDEAKNAKEAWEWGTVSREFYREKIGATDQDAPSPEDEEFLLALKGRSLPGEEEELEEGETPGDEGGTGADVEEGPPDEEDQPARNQRSAQTAAAAFKIIGASELAVTRARSLAGARLVSRSKGCEPCKEAIADVPHSAVASALGPEQVQRLVASPAELVAGAGAELAETIGGWGVGGEWTGELGRMVEAHAVRTLYESDPPPLPAGFAAVVTRALQQ